MGKREWSGTDTKSASEAAGMNLVISPFKSSGSSQRPKEDAQLRRSSLQTF